MPWLSSAAAADTCADFAKVMNMFNMIENDCKEFDLTPFGKRMRMDFAAKIAKESAGKPERCMNEGKIKMMVDLTTKKILDAVEKNEGDRAIEMFCERVHEQLNGASLVERGAAMSKRRSK